MSDSKQAIEKLETIMRALADVWPADRENLAKAGAAYEDFIDEFEPEGVQLKKLIDLALKGMIHLYREDDYFMSVKSGTMQAVNMVREYLVQEGEIEVAEFEKAYSELQNALEGGGESADTLLEADDRDSNSDKAGIEAAPDGDGNESSKRQPTSTDSASSVHPAGEENTIHDLGTFLMMIDRENPDVSQLRILSDILDRLGHRYAGSIADGLHTAKSMLDEVIEKGVTGNDWFDRLSKVVEKAIQVEQAQSVNETAAEQREETGHKSCRDNEKVPDKGLSEDLSTDFGPVGVEPPEEFHIPEEMEPDMATEFVTECNELIEAAESALLELEERPEDDDLVNTIFRAFHTIKGTSAFMGLTPMSEFTHAVETLLSMVRDGEYRFDHACADISFESIDIIKKMLESVEHAAGGDLLLLPYGYSSLLHVLEQIAEQGREPSEALGDRPKEARELVSGNNVVHEEKPGSGFGNDTPSGKSSGGRPEAEQSVRVNVGRLDRLIDMVGELVIAHSVVAQDPAITADAELTRKVNHATKILRELQDSSLTLRMVPLRATFHKMNRLVRDLGRKAGKSVTFETVGEDTEIDRNMVDVINEPLVHMLRNAIDHGIETPDDRTAAGKPESARVWLRAFQEGGKVVIEIEDDGRGIDPERIRSKAISRGLIDEEDKLNEKEIYNLIFLPGFSSTDQVTDLSGRGVGMDVVKRSIEQLQGKIDVESEPGEGTRISIELPFTLAITDGMLVRVGQERFIVPTINIDMTFRAGEEDIYTMMGTTEHVSFRGRSVPVIRLHRLFEIDGAVEELQEGTLLVIKNNDRRYALLVDEVIGQQQLVGKSINMTVKMEHISGGAILGDGQVGLILDTTALVMN